MDFAAGELMKQATLKVTVTDARRLNARLRIAVLLIRLAGWVAGLGGVEVTDGKEAK